ncbi:MAG: SPFH domain-containing protein [Planctomycetota bacterium]
MSPWAPRPGSFSQESPPTEEPRPPRRWARVLFELWKNFHEDILTILIVSIMALLRAMGAQVRTGQAGLLFSFGRATRILGHGFHPLIPFFQQVDLIPVRSRTMDLPSQKVMARDGLVYIADANLVYHVVDVKKAIIEIYELEKGMLQMLTMGVQEVLRAADRESIRDIPALGLALEQNLTQRLEPWGVAVDKAGFPSLSPSPRTLRITQLEQQVLERRRRHRELIDAGLEPKAALLLVGTRRFPVHA